jgi:phosphomannomutase/phosphoglucomutase
MSDLPIKLPSFFRSYDIRGIYGDEITEDVAYKIGKAFGCYLGNNGVVNVGRDTRKGSKTLSDSLISGLQDFGCNVLNLGMVPSPILYFSAVKTDSIAGVMITASHLPHEWNGFKFCDRYGQVISEGTGLDQIGLHYLEDKKIIYKKGFQTEYTNILDDYYDTFKKRISHIRNNFAVALDTSNSVPSLFLPKLFNKFGINSNFINDEILEIPSHDVEPSYQSMKKLSEYVIETGSEIGIMYDSDGDRIAFVDQTGKMYPDGIILIAIFSKILSLYNKNGSIVLDVTCPTSLLEYIERIGFTPLISRVGHNFCSSMALQNKSLFAAQFSGHIAMKDTEYRDDAIYASLKLLEFISNLDAPINEFISKNIPKFYYETISFEVPDNMKFTFMDKIIKNVKEKEKQILEIDGIKVIYTDGSYLIRSSNTSNIIRVMAEGKDASSMKKYMKIAKKEAQDVIEHD